MDKSGTAVINELSLMIESFENQIYIILSGQTLIISLAIIGSDYPAGYRKSIITKKTREPMRSAHANRPLYCHPKNVEEIREMRYNKQNDFGGRITAVCYLCFRNPKSRKQLSCINVFLVLPALGT